jgi:hypothetical protein
MKMTSQRARTLAVDTMDAYSHSRFGEAQWLLCAGLLVDELKFSIEEASWVLFSKWMRWAADTADSDSPQVDDLRRFLASEGADHGVSTVRDYIKTRG